jgi:uncharacterized protein YrrD
MERDINSIIGYRMVATDGEIGKVDDFYFDDETWVIRYLIVEMQVGMSGRKVLITPEALVRDRPVKEVFFVDHTRDQILNSPDIDTDKPVFRQQEIELYGHYAWKGYWESGFYAGGLGSVVDGLPEGTRRLGADLHLRSCCYVTGFHVHGTDGEIGYVCDFIVDDRTWKLLYLVVDARPFRGGKKVLISVEHILQMRWSDSDIYVDETEACVLKSKVFELAAFTDLPKD